MLKMVSRLRRRLRRAFLKIRGRYRNIIYILRKRRRRLSRHRRMALFHGRTTRVRRRIVYADGARAGAGSGRRGRSAGGRGGGAGREGDRAGTKLADRDERSD